MTTETRRPRADEMVAYFRALPVGNGLPSWEPADAAWHGGNEPFPPPGRPPTPEALQAWGDNSLASPGYHPIATFVDGSCVGASAAISFEVTVPGGSTMSMAGITATGVIATHRRRGHLRRMMQAMFDAALERGEPIAMLSASEGSIYGNFGFSPATYRVRWEIARHQAALIPADPDRGSLELVDATAARAAWPTLHARVRGLRVGELTTPPGYWDRLSDEADGTNGPLRYLIHRDENGVVDGLANFRLPWSSTSERAGTLVVEALEAIDSAAYRALWSLLLDFDLTKTIVAASRPREEPLKWMLANPRAMRVTRQSDNLWSRLLDAPAALRSRSYGADGSVVLEVLEDAMCPKNVGKWLLEIQNGSASCVATDRAADVSLTIPALSSLFLGGTSAHNLAFAGRIHGHTAAVVDLLARMFQIDPEPHNSFGF